MKYFIFVFISIVLSVITGYKGMKVLDKYFVNNTYVLGYSTDVEFNIYPTNTPTPTPSPTPTPTLTPTPIPTNTPIPTPTSIPQPDYSQEQIHVLIERFSGQYAIDPNVLRHIATCESRFNQKAINKYYAGLYQFSSTTWTNLRIEMGEDENADLRFNAEEAVQTAAYALSVGKGNIWPNCIP
jgi:hypothetical protein